MEYIQIHLMLAVTDLKMPQKDYVKYVAQQLVMAFPQEGPVNIMIIEAIVPHGDNEEDESELTKGKKMAVSSIADLLRDMSKN